MQTHKCSLLFMGSHCFSNKVVLTKFISTCRMIWDLIWGIHQVFISQKVKREVKSAIWCYWCCQQSITVLSTPPTSMTYICHMGVYWYEAPCTHLNQPQVFMHLSNIIFGLSKKAIINTSFTNVFLRCAV